FGAIVERRESLNAHEGFLTPALFASDAGSGPCSPSLCHACAHTGASGVRRSCRRGIPEDGYADSADHAGEKTCSLLRPPLHAAADCSRAGAVCPGCTRRAGMGLRPRIAAPFGKQLLAVSAGRFPRATALHRFQCLSSPSLIYHPFLIAQATDFLAP